MQLGSFSISLAVKDIAGSKAFYQKLGFEVFGGEESQNWLILKNGMHVIGLFQGMFEKNILTFNPGWDQEAQPSRPSRMSASSSGASKSKAWRSPVKRTKTPPGPPASPCWIQMGTQSCSISMCDPHAGSA